MEAGSALVGAKPAAAVPHPGPAHPASIEAGSHVLVAEDHDVNQLLILAMLRQIGCNGILAANGKEALDMVEAARATGRPYDLLLMDIQMPVMDGPEATRRIRALGISASELPIVALTANAYAEDVSACLTAGMQDHLAKPVTLASLESALRRWSNHGVGASPLASPKKALTISPKVRERYQLRKVEALRALDELVRRGSFSDAELIEVAALMHKLAGTAAMFEDVELGDRASALEEGIGDWDVESRADKICAAVEAIRRAA
ncbi:MAG: response regulator [Zymomonas sp.]|nr:MAG: response regulator [Zymomonas sp.]